jgi:hypothetical protein
MHKVKTAAQLINYKIVSSECALLSTSFNIKGSSTCTGIYCR